MKLALYRSVAGDKLDTIIDLFSGRYGYSHVELIFDNVDGSWFSSSPRDGACRFKNIVPKEKHWVIVDLPEIDYIQEVNIYSLAKCLVGDKYDYYGILFWYVFFWVKKQKDKNWWCSEVVAYLLGHVDYRVTPNELAKYYHAPKSEFKITFSKTFNKE